MVTQSTLDLIKNFEGVRKVAYKDIAGKWTIGVGHLILINEHDLLTKELTDQEVNDLLMKDLQQVINCINSHVLIKPTQNQFDALASFIFNLGCPNFSSSTLCKYINGGYSKIDITKQWLKWDHISGQYSQGLDKRRQEEVKVYFS